MNFIEEFRKLENAEFGFFVFFACGSVCPGILAIWMFNPQMLVASSTPKLIVLSLSFMLPYISLNSFIVGMTGGNTAGNPNNKSYIQFFCIAGIFSLLMFSFCLVIKFFFDVSLHSFLIILAILEFFFFVHQINSLRKPQLLSKTGQAGQAQPPADQPKP
ncbi:MAG: hypothetical protein ABSF51_03975 [Verrucomicrobiota bacterium]|jgi:hypothetical protein